MSGHGIEWTPLGPVPLGDGQLVARELNVARPDGAVTAEEAERGARFLVQRVIDTTGHEVPDVAPQSAPKPTAPLASRAASRATPAAPVTDAAPRDIVRAAKARIAEINAEIRRLAALTRERDELVRLVRAAKARPPRKPALRAVS